VQGDRTELIRVALDARLLDLPGVGRYIECLAEGFSSRPLDSIRIVLYVRDVNGERERRWSATGNVDVVGARVQTPSLQEQAYWPMRIREDRIEVFHAPHFVFPALIQIPTVVTLHDAVYFRFPPAGLKRLPMRLYYHAMHALVARRASAVITVSRFSESELSALLGIDAARIRVITEAVSPDFSTQDHAQSGPSRSAPYILYVGTNKPWKNLDMLLRAIAKARESNPSISVILAGKTGRNEQDVRGKVSAMGLGAAVQVLGEVTASRLRELYRLATAVVCPSLYEGFGLTALEAMACGAPLIASNAASLPEVVGDAAVSLSPNDTEGWATAMNELWFNSSKRERLRAAGILRAREFTVTRMCDQTASVYRRLFARHA
jgi:glycosyltransferase involved in cell wall biosynthesis